MRREVQVAKPRLTLTPLHAADTTLVPVQPQFLQTLSDHLGDHLTSADGFDDLLNTPLSLIDPESDTVDHLGIVAASVASTTGAITSASLDPIATDLVTFQSNGDTILGGVGTDVAPPPAPPAPPPPPDASGDGSGSDKPSQADNPTDLWQDWGDVLDNIGG